MNKKTVEDGMPIGLTLEPGTDHRCTCGKSRNPPFCDESHRGASDLSPIAFKIRKREKVTLRLRPDRGSALLRRQLRRIRGGEGLTRLFVGG